VGVAAFSSLPNFARLFPLENYFLAAPTLGSLFLTGIVETQD